MAGLGLSQLGKQPGDSRAAPGSARKCIDTVPHIPASGKKGEIAPWSCEPNLILPSPSTPENRSDLLLRHKKRSAPGQITVHWGLQTVTKPDPGIGYGVKSDKGDNVAQNFRLNQKLGIEEYMQSRGEAIYYSVQREPLGSSYIRGHRLPEEKQKNGFGKKCARDEFDAKEIVFPRWSDNDNEEEKERYKKTHGAYDPGEMISRKYEWPQKITANPHFRFGLTDEGRIGSLQSGNGAKSVLYMDKEIDNTLPRTRIGQKTAENFREVANDQLATSRNLLQGQVPLPAGHSFGLKSGADMTHAGELVRGFYPPDEQQPDSDLGKCTVKGRRNFQTRRPFGVPTVRMDLDAPPHHKRSVASCTNYGDDHDAYGLLYPEKFGHRGVSDADFIQRRPASELRKLVEGAGYTLKDEQFQMLWNEGVKLFGDDVQLVSLEIYLALLADWMSQTGVTLQSMKQTQDSQATQRPQGEQDMDITGVENFIDEIKAAETCAMEETGNSAERMLAELAA
jgi:hypothetical protein